MRKTFALLAVAALAATAARAEPIGIDGAIVNADTGANIFDIGGGTATDTVRYRGLKPGAGYVIISRLIDPETDRRLPAVSTEFTPTGGEGEVEIAFPVPANETGNLQGYVVETSLSIRDAATGLDGYIGTMHGDAANPARSILLRGPQAMRVVSVTDAKDGDTDLDASGSEVVLTAEHAGLDPERGYVVWGEMADENGDETGIYTSIRDFAPESADGSIEMTFTVPGGNGGKSLIPLLGLYDREMVDFDEAGLMMLRDGAEGRPLITADVATGPVLTVTPAPEPDAETPEDAPEEADEVEPPSAE